MDSLQQHWKIPLNFLGEIDHLMTLIFYYEKYFSCCLLYFNTWGWRKSWIIFFSWWFFVWCFSSRCFSVFIWPRKFSDDFSISFPFSGKLDGLRPGTYFSTPEIFLIFIKFLVFWGNISCVKIFVGPVW